MEEFQEDFRLLENECPFKSWKVLEGIWNTNTRPAFRSILSVENKMKNNKMTVGEVVRATHTFISSADWKRLLLWHLDNYSKASKELEEKTHAALQQQIEKLYNNLQRLYEGDLPELMTIHIVNGN